MCVFACVQDHAYMHIKLQYASKILKRTLTQPVYLYHWDLCTTRRFWELADYERDHVNSTV